MFFSLLAIQCRNLSPPANGQVAVSGLRVGSQATYTCNTGYTLVGNRQRTCRPDGQWSGEEPICEGTQSRLAFNRANFNRIYLISGIECPSLSPPANGQVDVSGLRPGSLARYSCNPGFSLSGAVIRTCQNNGQWNREAPTCICKPIIAFLLLHSINNPFSLTHSTAVLCSELPAPENGEISVSGLTPGSVASYSCLPGFTLEGVTLRTCQTTGIWTFDAPVCVGESLYLPLQEKRFSSGAFAQTELFNVNEISNTLWLCVCTEVRCPQLPDPVNGEVVLSGNTPSSTATYFCNSGYELQGIKIRTCQTDGQWSNTAPVCIGKL